LRDLKGELFTLTNQVALFDKTRKEENDWNKKVVELTVAIQQQENLIDEIRSGEIYKNAFEWRFEFPEVLDDNGDFTGFDLVIGNPPYFSISTNERLRVLADRYETYVQTGDVYALFYELGINILKNNGFQSLIVSNKWMRANYGMYLRRYILSKSNPLLLVDFGQNLLFEHAIVHANIIFAQKCPNQESMSAIRFDDNKFSDFVKVLGAFIEKNKIDDLHFDENSWNIEQKKVLAIKNKVELRHLPLKDWEIKFNRGILTGLNEAFILDGKQKDRILMNEPQSAKFIKPILRGRDTRRYYADYKDYWILNIPKGYTIKTKLGIGGVVLEPVPSYGNVKFDEAWDWFSANHPLVAGHLAFFKQKAEKREDQGDFWWELRACSYIAEFEKPKIIFSEIVSEPQFYFDEKGYYPEATVFFITGKKLKYITALLNSKPVTYLFKTFYMGGELVGKIRYKKAFLEKVPIPIPSEEQELIIVDLVDRIILQKQQNKTTSAFESQIDQMVYKLYDLTQKEINLIEKAN